MHGEEYAAYLQSAKWVRKRQESLERFGHRCGVCYSDGRLAVHHRTYERCGDELVEDLIPLCERCHEAFHGGGSNVLPLGERECTLQHGIPNHETNEICPCWRNGYLDGFREGVEAGRYDAEYAIVTHLGGIPREVGILNK